MSKQLFKNEAANRRKHKQKIKKSGAIIFDTSRSNFLPTMTYMALKDDASASQLIALCNYVMSK